MRYNECTRELLTSVVVLLTPIQTCWNLEKATGRSWRKCYALICFYPCSICYPLTFICITVRFTIYDILQATYVFCYLREIPPDIPVVLNLSNCSGKGLNKYFCSIIANSLSIYVKTLHTLQNRLTLVTFYVQVDSLCSQPLVEKLKRPPWILEETNNFVKEHCLKTFPLVA